MTLRLGRSLVADPCSMVGWISWTWNKRVDGAVRKESKARRRVHCLAPLFAQGWSVNHGPFLHRLLFHVHQANRHMLSVITTFSFSPTNISTKALLYEGVDANSIVQTGNTVIDTIKWMLKQTPPDHHILNRLSKTDKKVVLVTSHRRESLGEVLCDAPLQYSIPPPLIQDTATCGFAALAPDILWPARVASLTGAAWPARMESWTVAACPACMESEGDDHRRTLTQPSPNPPSPTLIKDPYPILSHPCPTPSLPHPTLTHPCTPSANPRLMAKILLVQEVQDTQGGRGGWVVGPQGFSFDWAPIKHHGTEAPTSGGVLRIIELDGGCMANFRGCMGHELRGAFIPHPKRCRI